MSRIPMAPPERPPGTPPSSGDDRGPPTVNQCASHEALARVYAAAYSSHMAFSKNFDTALAAASVAVREFCLLLRSPIE